MEQAAAMEQTEKVQEYSATEAGLAQLRARMQGVVYDVSTTVGMEAARKDRRELVTLRTSLEAKRKEIKAPALERCRLIDEEAKRITTEIVALESPIDRQIKTEEARKEAERQAKIEAERKRVEAIKEKIGKISALPLQAVSVTASVVADFIADIEANVKLTPEEFQECLPMAIAAKDEALANLREIHAEKTAAEAEAARIQAEREEAERRRVEEEKRLAEERERLQKEREAFEREQAEARRLREEEEAKIRAAREEEERKIREEREAEERRLEAERAELRRQQEEAEAKRRAEEAEVAERERLQREAEASEELRRREEEFQARLRTPFEAIQAILEIAEDTNLTDRAARQRIIQAAKTALAGRG